ncbi:hypothetical protein KBC75_00645 [Candidatus Shapirobacteria bacterium]|nr:hypothetical protein [Candidatus Shapirobacteria bacterium]
MIKTFDTTLSARQFIEANLKTEESELAFLLHFVGKTLERTHVVGENEILVGFGMLQVRKDISTMIKIPLYAGVYGEMLADAVISYRNGRRPEELDNVTIDGFLEQIKPREKN